MKTGRRTTLPARVLQAPVADGGSLLLDLDVVFGFDVLTLEALVSHRGDVSRFVLPLRAAAGRVPCLRRRPTRVGGFSGRPLHLVGSPGRLRSWPDRSPCRPCAGPFRPCPGRPSLRVPSRPWRSAWFPGLRSAAFRWFHARFPWPARGRRPEPRPGYHPPAGWRESAARQALRPRRRCRSPRAGGRTSAGRLRPRAAGSDDGRSTGSARSSDPVRST